MLKSKARGRIAARAAAIGAVSAGLILGIGPIMSALAVEKTVTFTCTAGATSGGTGTSFTLNVSLNSGLTTVPVNSGVPITWKVSQPATSALPVPEGTSIATTDKIGVVPTLVASPFPTPTVSQAQTVTPTAVLSPATTATAGAPIPFPATGAVVTLTPKATGTFTVREAGFSVYVAPTGSAFGSTNVLYNCVPATTEGNAAAITLTVTTASASNTNSATATPTTPRPTRTVTATVTASQSAQVSQTPGGGASTGGGGDIGPDGRVLILTGTALILAAVVGGLMLRSRQKPQNSA